MADDVIDAHLERCVDCARFAEAVSQYHRRSRIRPAAPVPDLTAQILARLAVSPPRRRHRPGRRAGAALAAAVAVALAFAGGGILSSHLDHPSRSVTTGAASGGLATVRQVAGPAQTSTRYPGATVMAIGVPKPRVALTDTSAQPYNLTNETARKVTLIYFGYTHCPDLCPINMALTAAALRDMPAAQRRQVAVVFITTDPARDTPKVIRAWLDRFDPSFVGLTGSVAAIHQAEVQVQMPLSYPDPTVGATPQTATETGRDYRVVHAGYTLVYSQDGRANLTVDDSARPAQFATTIEHVLSYGFQESS